MLNGRNRTNHKLERIMKHHRGEHQNATRQNASINNHIYMIVSEKSIEFYLIYCMEMFIISIQTDENGLRRGSSSKLDRKRQSTTK